MEEENPNSMYLSAYVLEELLLKLPLKSLSRFKSVSKEWKSILESKCFVERHLSLAKSGRKILLAAYHCDCSVSPSRLLHKSRFEGGEEFVFLHCDATRPSMSCDGLVCIPEAECVNVFNPSTGQLWRFHSPSLLNPSLNSTFPNGKIYSLCSTRVKRFVWIYALKNFIFSGSYMVDLFPGILCNGIR